MALISGLIDSSNIQWTQLFCSQLVLEQYMQALDFEQ